MEKLLLPLLILVSIFVSACNHDDASMDLSLLRGQWQVSNDESSDDATVYNISTTKDFDNWGVFEIYRLINDGQEVTKFPVREYHWHVRLPDNNDPKYTMAIVPVDANDDELLQLSETYEITYLSNERMVWESITPTEGKVINFIRRTDL